MPPSRCQQRDLYKWKAKFGGLEVSEAKRLRQIEDENTKLKKLLAEAMLDNAMLKEITAKIVAPLPAEAVAHLEEVFEVSQRRACDVLGVDRTMVRYRSRRGDDGAIRERMRAWRRSAAGLAIAVYTG
jgi:putative transposase